ncbi:uncharacterized protein LOC133204970 [Saccostrea echinata]|uniref:uncharacterized protein LOC133204970 n=1 Tax=Saccostrea echinata TaxID=191078 RepID=UPI002A8221E6|nr:uncharacterized protein LOC133204970 [Saccostrea echinata]
MAGTRRFLYKKKYGGPKVIFKMVVILIFMILEIACDCPFSKCDPEIRDEWSCSGKNHVIRHCACDALEPVIDVHPEIVIPTEMDMNILFRFTGDDIEISNTVNECSSVFSLRNMSGEGNTDACPVTKETWEARAAMKKADCGGQSVYHCLSDSVGGKWERCVEKSKIIGGQCPIFTNDGFIDWQSCNTTIPTCPNSSYVSNEVYKFPICFGKNIPKEKIPANSINGKKHLRSKKVVHKKAIKKGNMLPSVCDFLRHPRIARAEDPNDEGAGDLSAGEIAAIVVVIGIIAIVVAVILFIFIFRRNRRQKDPIVDNGLKALSRKDGKSLFVHGKFGNSVSSTSRLILDKFVEENEEWKSVEFRYTDIPDNVEENTIMFVYGWFGLWNDDPCSVDKVKKACQDLNNILYKYTNVKIIIGMRSEHHRKYHTLGCFTRSPLFRNELSLDSENFEKHEEHFQYFKERIKEPCQKEECHCHDLRFETFKDDRDSEIGIPLKMNVLERYHDVIDDYVIKGSLLQAMTDHITGLEGDKETKSTYEWLMYICLKGQYNRSEEFDTELINTMAFAINKSSFDEFKESLSKYIRIRNSDKQKNIPPESAQYVFWHPFIYICAFHSLFMKNPDIVMSHCNIDAILQLVRPERNVDTYLEVRAENDMIDLFNQRIRLEGLQDVYKDHPLVTPSADTGENIDDVGQSSEEIPNVQPVIINLQMNMTM